jgi:DNA-binding GntR family transcriptional regulator
VADIVTLRFQPGQVLSEQELAVAYGVSRTPVREAVQRLRHAALVEVRPQVGTVVAAFSLSRFREAQFVRETLEVACIELAVQRPDIPTGPDLAALQTELAAQKIAADAGDVVAFTRHDEQMHRIICGLSGHAGVWDTIAQSKVHLDRVRHLSLVTEGIMRRLYGQHRAIVAAIAARDEAAAILTARRHTRESLRAAVGLERSHPDYFGTIPAVPSRATPA